VYISDTSRNKALVHTGNKWDIKNATDIVDRLFDRAIIFAEDKHEECEDYLNDNKNKSIKKKVDKEMKLLNLMNEPDPEPYDINDNGDPVDVNGNIMDKTNVKRGERLNAKAKENIKLTLYNNKDKIVI
jgi:hypothetical protein